MRIPYAAATLFAVPLVLTMASAQQTPQDRPASPDRNAPRPIDAGDSVWIEELTWMEVRDAIRGGKTTAIIPTGGIEQNGPYTATGKHNFVLQATAEAIARRLGDALVAPIVKFVPEGRIDPPSGHMQYSGTISLREETFVALLTDIASSLKQHGFRDIVFIGDSGGNTRGMQTVTETLNGQWKDGGVRVHHVREYYESDMWSFDYLKEIGIKQMPDVKSASRAPGSTTTTTTSRSSRRWTRGTSGSKSGRRRDCSRSMAWTWTRPRRQSRTERS